MDNPPVAETEQIPGNPRRLLLAAGALAVLLVVAAVSTYIWYYFYSPCGVNNVKAASTALVEQVNQFEEAFRLATSVSRTALIGPVTRMQQILIDTREVVVPACMLLARNELITSMESAIRAVLAYMAQGPDEAVTNLMEDATIHLENFNAELEAVNECAPLCR